jgi:Domain of unknown function (DUF1874).
MRPVLLVDSYLKVLNWLKDAGRMFAPHPLTINQAREVLQKGFISLVEDETVADVVSTLLGISVPVNQAGIPLKENDLLIVVHTEPLEGWQELNRSELLSRMSFMLVVVK